MAFIDFGALLRVNGNFVNKNKALFMESSDTGYICESAIDSRGDTLRIQGNYFVYAGDEDLLLVFYKTQYKVISRGKVMVEGWAEIAASRTYQIDGFPDITISHLDKKLYPDLIDIGDSWEEFVRKNWINDDGSEPTGNEPLSKLQGGLEEYKKFHKRRRSLIRFNKNGGFGKYRTPRWLAEWTYKEKNTKLYSVMVLTLMRIYGMRLKTITRGN